MKYMVYYAYSARRWSKFTTQTFSYLLKEIIGYRGILDGTDEKDRISYDKNQNNESAPYTDFISKKSFRKITNFFSSCDFSIENFEKGDLPFYKNWTREKWLNTPIPSILGLDMYGTLKK